MSAWLIALVTFIYLWVTVSFFGEGRTGMGIAFLGYAVANVGLILDAVTKGQ